MIHSLEKDTPIKYYLMFNVSHLLKPPGLVESRSFLSRRAAGAQTPTALAVTSDGRLSTRP